VQAVIAMTGEVSVNRQP